MSKELRILVEKVKNKESLEEFLPLNKTLIDEIIQLKDISDFHLILNYVEKYNSQLSEEIMSQKKRLYQKLLDSYDCKTHLFNQDQQILDRVSHYINLCNSNRQISSKKYDVINEKYSNLLKQKFGTIKGIIESGVDNNQSFDEVIKKLKEELTLTNDDIKNIEGLYREIKDYYELDGKFYEQEQTEYHALLGSISSIYSDEIEKCMMKFIRTGKINEIEQLMKQHKSELFRNMLISNFFEDVLENFIKNLLNVVNFQLEIDDFFIDRNMLVILQNIIDSLDETDENVLYELFNDMQNRNINYKSEFYDIFNSARKLNAQMLMDSVLKISNTSLQKTSIEGVDCFLLNGEPFYMMVHSSSHKISDFQGQEHDGLSMSFISGDRLNVYNETVIYGFTDLLPNQFVELYTRDTATEYNMGDEEKSLLGAVPEFHKPSKFIEHTPKNSINEILYLSGKKESIDNYPGLVTPKPNYIVCYDTINQESMESAKELNIPIVIVNTKKYPERQKDNMGHFAFLDDQETYRNL